MVKGVLCRVCDGMFDAGQVDGDRVPADAGRPEKRKTLDAAVVEEDP